MGRGKAPAFACLLGLPGGETEREVLAGDPGLNRPGPPNMELCRYALTGRNASGTNQLVHATSPAADGVDGAVGAVAVP